MFLVFFTVLYRTVILGYFLWIFARWIYKNLPDYTFFVFLAISLSINLWQLPEVKVATKKIITYDATEIKIDFNTTLTLQEQKSNIEQLIEYFVGHEKRFSTAMRMVGDRYRTAPVKPKTFSAILHHYWKYENNSLYLYLSNPLKGKNLTIFKNMMYDRFFSTLEIPNEIKINSISKPLYVQMLLKDYDFKNLKPLKLDNDFAYVSIVEFNRGIIGEQKAICAFELKLTNDEYWNFIYEQSLNHKLPLKLMMGLKKETPIKEFKHRLYNILSQVDLKIELFNKTFDARVITYKDRPNQYLSLVLEKYDDVTLDDSKPHILIDPVFKDQAEDIRKDCYKNVIFRYPKLRELVTKKAYLKDFHSQPTKISIKNVRFSPLYGDVNEIDGF